MRKPRKWILILLPLLVAAVSQTAPATAAISDGDLARNKAIGRRVFEEIFSKGEVARIDATYAPDFVDESRGGGSSPELIRKAVAGWRAACPDLSIAVADVLAEGDEVVVRWIATGTQTGEWQGLPPTGKHVRVTGQSTFRIVQGKIAREWTQLDWLGLYEQLGFTLRPPAP
jgi:steroid delta-isomerase-like uncharacterized protein